MQLAADPFDAGPYNRFQASLGLIRSDSPRVATRAALLAFLAWAPLVLFATIEGLAIGPTRQESMLLDVATHARYLLALPLLVIAEATCPAGLASIARHFGDAGLIPEASQSRYHALLESTRRMLASPRTDLVILLLAYLVTLTITPPLYPKTVSTWVRPLSSGYELSLAGRWATIVSQPLYLVLLLAWLWRVSMWARFLRGVSRLDLKLVPSHPDSAGGVGFVGTSIGSFLLLAFALAIPVAAAVGQEIASRGRSIVDFAYVIAAVVIGELVLFTAPLFLLTPRLLRVRKKGLFQYGALAGTVGQHFENRWLASERTAGAEALAVQDFSATTDLYSITANVQQMKLVPLTITQAGMLLVVALLPFVPVVLMALPIKQILTYIAKLVF